MDPLAFVLECNEGSGDLGAGLGRVNHCVDEAAIGRDVGVEESFLVGIFEGLAIFIGNAAIEDLDRTFGAHDRD